MELNVNKNIISVDILPALKGGDSQVANVPCEGEPSSYGDSLMRQCPASVYYHPIQKTTT